MAPSDTVSRPPSPDSGYRPRWTDSSKVIYGLFGTIGILLGMGLSATTWWAQSEISKNARQIEEVDDSLNKHLQDPEIHRAGMKGLNATLSNVDDKLEEIKTDQKGIIMDQRSMKTDIEIIKRTIGNR